MGRITHYSNSRCPYHRAIYWVYVNRVYVVLISLTLMAILTFLFFA